VSSAERAFAAIFSLLMLGAVVSPALRDPPADSFPLSDYPMFSHGRPDAILVITHALGVDEEGREEPLPPMISAGNREVLQSMMTIHGAVAGGRAAPFCQEVAERVLVSGAHDEVREVVLATSRYDGVAYFEGEARPLDRRVLHRCEVPR